jgi:hypothetical protein
MAERGRNRLASSVGGRTKPLMFSLLPRCGLDRLNLLPIADVTKETPPIRGSAFASLKAPSRPVRAKVDPTDESEEREASGRRRIPPCDSRKTTARPLEARDNRVTGSGVMSRCVLIW